MTQDEKDVLLLLLGLGSGFNLGAFFITWNPLSIIWFYILLVLYAQVEKRQVKG